MPESSPSYVLSLALLLGVMGGGACSSAPGGRVREPTADELSRLREEQATLRKRVQVLEAELGRLEDAKAVSVTGTTREIPVVRLMPAGPPVSDDLPRDSVSQSRNARRAEEPASRVRPRGAVSLDAVPHRTPDLAEESTGAYTEPFDGAPVSRSGEPGDEVPSPTGARDRRSARARTTAMPGAPKSTVLPEATGGSESLGGMERPTFRLVGTHLVELTKTRGPKGPDRPGRDSKGQAIVRAYEAAMASYRTGELREAEAAFDRFAREHPQHDYADNALYWKGEAAYDEGRYADALAAFTEVVERYGGGNKAPDALLKVGLCYRKIGDRANARDVLTELVAAYPRASASAIARERLEELERDP